MTIRHIAFAVLVSFFTTLGCGTKAKKLSEDISGIDADTNRIREFCGDCHSFPPPSSFERNKWAAEVEQGFNLYKASGRKDLTPPDLKKTVEWFENNAPEKHHLKRHNSPASLNRFTKKEINFGGDSFVSISNIRKIEDSQKIEFGLTDMYQGDVWLAAQEHESFSVKLIGKVRNPAHVEPVDFNSDNVLEFLVGDLGAYYPADHQNGCLWLFRSTGNNNWERHLLKAALSRVCDISKMDCDNDGDVDLIVSDFGWRKTGSLYLAMNEGLNSDGIPKFRWTTIDNRHGAIKTCVLDYNSDGNLDFVVVFAQEHESVELFVNKGDGNFDKMIVHQAKDPSYGSSGMHLVDLDQDGDEDVLYTNGDSFDKYLAKPYHAIHWLENTGTFPFVDHQLTAMPGVYDAVAGDVDNDGDLDIVAVAMLLEKTTSSASDGTCEAAIWLEQTEPGKFFRHGIEGVPCQYSTCRLIDWNADGYLDILAGRFDYDRKPSKSLTLFENRPGAN